MPERYLGQTLGKYRIDAVIGSGGFAWVYKAFDPELEIPVALKILKPQYAGDESFEQRFRREASTAARLRHPNIINIFAVGKENGAVYFAMDYLPQGLADRLSVMTTLPESMLIRMAIDVSSALGFAHREGVIHRDIKTDNILFDEHGNAVVADFGIARAVAGYAEQTGTNMVMGTPQYFAPEQARGLSLDGRADIYSLGVTLFKAATGALPFTGEDWYEIARQHVEEKPPRVRSLNASISRELEDVILRCLEKNPDDRYPSGESMCEDLASILQERGESVAMRTLGNPTAATLPPGTALPKLRRRRRGANPILWAGGGLAVLMVLILIFTMGGDKTASGSVVAPPAGAGGSVLNLPPADPATTRRVLRVTAPESALVTVGTVEVGRGPWSSDTLPPANYTITARIPGRAECPTVSVTKNVAVGPGQPDTVSLQPRECGWVNIVMLDRTRRDAEATYTLTNLEWRKGGPIPRNDVVRVLVPTGQTQLVVRTPLCSDFRTSITVKKNAESRIPFRRICGPG